MNIKIIPRALSGTINANTSKSVLHRLLICSALADDKTILTDVNCISEDIKATIACLEHLGSKIVVDVNKREIIVSPALLNAKKSVTLNSKESGTTLRLLMPIANYIASKVTFTCDEGLKKRPIKDFIYSLKEAGLNIIQSENPIVLSGQLMADTFKVVGDVSSQYISGLMLSAPVSQRMITIRPTTPVESINYIELTADILNKFNVSTKREQSDFKVDGTKGYLTPKKIAAEGDWSNGAFFICAGLLGGKIRLSGLLEHSKQGDKAIITLLKSMGKLEVSKAYVHSEKSRLQALDIDFTDIPDLFPIMSVMAAFAVGESRLYGGKRLKLKESDRIASSFALLKALGADAQMTEDGMVIKGKEMLDGGTVDSFNDHRIAMAAAIASIKCKNPVIIKRAEAVNKSYPHFFEDFKTLGGEYHIV